MQPKHKDILSILKIEPSARSIDFVTQKKQFQLHSLLTEQRHPRTWNLSSTMQKDISEGLGQIFSVDADISHKFSEISQDTALLESAAEAVRHALINDKKIYIYGCGATGRLAKQMESSLWRPFWGKVRKRGLWDKLDHFLPPDIENRLIGEMTGGDRALISSLEGFEDLELVGELQLKDRGIEPGDVVFCISEGGETSSVLGTLTAAFRLNEASELTNSPDADRLLFFIYNNPDELLRPLERSRSVIENPAINRINLTTGPQAITGSTRMQAATSETFILGAILEAAIYGLMREALSQKELSRLGFGPDFKIKDRLSTFNRLRELINNSIGRLARLTRFESEAYRQGRRAIYFAEQALLPVFTDCAERSPTFHLDPLDTVQEPGKKCWLQVWTGARDPRSAWNSLLGRRFRGLDENFYRPDFETKIEDPYLKSAALNSLNLAGFDQEALFDFSFSDRNITGNGPESGDMGILVCVDEEISDLDHPDSPMARFIALAKEKGARMALISVGDQSDEEAESKFYRLPLDREKDAALHFCMAGIEDPLCLCRQILIKILLNGHSTAVMARLERVVGNTMTSVKPSNLKLIGRATALIAGHVNDTIAQKEWATAFGQTPSISYAEANAVLFEAMEFVALRDVQTSEVELSIIRILEALKGHSSGSWEEALSLVQKEGLVRGLVRLNPALRS